MNFDTWYMRSFMPASLHAISRQNARRTDINELVLAHLQLVCGVSRCCNRKAPTWPRSLRVLSQSARADSLLRGAVSHRASAFV